MDTLTVAPTADIQNRQEDVVKTAEKLNPTASQKQIPPEAQALIDAHKQYQTFKETFKKLDGTDKVDGGGITASLEQNKRKSTRK